MGNDIKNTLPDYANWQDGKTAASIRFARDIMILLQQNGGLTPEERTVLQDALRLIKSGEISFTAWITAEEYLIEWKRGC